MSWYYLVPSYLSQYTSRNGIPRVTWGHMMATRCMLVQVHPEMYDLEGDCIRMAHALMD